MQIEKWRGILTSDRYKAFCCIQKITNNINKSLDIESAIHSIATTKNMYIDKLQEILHNIRQNPNLINEGKEIISFSDNDMAMGTVVEFIQHEATMRCKRFDQMLQDKYETMNDNSYTSTLKCRKCGSADVSWEQKQTRGADEAMTVFCTCAKCKTRWKMS